MPIRKVHLVDVAGARGHHPGQATATCSELDAADSSMRVSDDVRPVLLEDCARSGQIMRRFDASETRRRAGRVECRCQTMTDAQRLSAPQEASEEDGAGPNGAPEPFAESLLYLSCAKRSGARVIPGLGGGISFRIPARTFIFTPSKSYRRVHIPSSSSSSGGTEWRSWAAIV